MSISPALEVVAAPEGAIAPWQVGDLIPPPKFGWRQSAELIGPGVLVAGSAIGAGEWLFGPAVTAQYGGTFLWLATFSIVFQVVYNLEVMRYALYCGEPIFIGFFRTRPGPRFWLLCYMTLFLAHIWPFMASNAAVPLASAMLGHLPGNGVVSLVGFSLTEIMLVKVLGYAVFFVAFLPLIFGGKISSMLEQLMLVKLVSFLGFCSSSGSSWSRPATSERSSRASFVSGRSLCVPTRSSPLLIFRYESGKVRRSTPYRGHSKTVSLSSRRSSFATADHPGGSSREPGYPTKRVSRLDARNSPSGRRRSHVEAVSTLSRSTRVPGTG